MSRDYDQAVHYARGCDRAGPEDATTLFELQMGLVDRGADRTRDGAPTRDWEAGLSSSFGRFPCAHPSRIRARPWEVTWLSQYPHEKEVLLPPLSGLEAIGSSVEGKLLQLNSRLSLNLAAQTLEQVLSRRRKMLMDMSTGIEFELRDTLGDGPLYKVALRILRRALAYGALAQTPEWFNDDVRKRHLNPCPSRARSFDPSHRFRLRAAKGRTFEFRLGRTTSARCLTRSSTCSAS